MISDTEVDTSWSIYRNHMRMWFLVWFFGFISSAVLWAFILKHAFKVKWKMWLLNDTVDGDFGTDSWIAAVNAKKGIKAFRTLFGLFKLKRGLYSAWLWWWRNHAWNYLMLTVPEWEGGSVDEFRQIELTIPYDQMFDSKGRYNRFTKASMSKEIYGINNYCYRLNGKVFCNYSEASPRKEKQRGAGGNEWRHWTKRSLF